MQVKICSYNVKGLGNDRKRNQIFNWLKHQNISICLLQETHSNNNTTDTWTKEWNGDAFFSGNSCSKEGICVLFNNNISYEIINYKNIITGRMQAVEIEINKSRVVIINIYGPNKDEVSFFEKLENVITENEEKIIIIGGDYNVVLNEVLDKKNGNINTHRQSRKKLNALIETFDLTDIWRIQHPDVK